MSIIKINDVELELDLLDADVMERFVQLNESTINEIQEPTQYDNLSAADGMRRQCRIIEKFFDKLFGAGTADKLFGGNNNLGKHLDAFAAVANESYGVRDQATSIVDKYDLGRLRNRDQRRRNTGRSGRNQKYKNKGGTAYKRR